VGRHGLSPVAVVSEGEGQVGAREAKSGQNLHIVQIWHL
jgi:hypothetical protein